MNNFNLGKLNSEKNLISSKFGIKYVISYLFNSKPIFITILDNFNSRFDGNKFVSILKDKNHIENKNYFDIYMYSKLKFFSKNNSFVKNISSDIKKKEFELLNVILTNGEIKEIIEKKKTIKYPIINEGFMFNF